VEAEVFARTPPGKTIIIVNKTIHFAPAKTPASGKVLWRIVADGRLGIAQSSARAADGTHFFGAFSFAGSQTLDGGGRVACGNHRDNGDNEL